LSDSRLQLMHPAPDHVSTSLCGPELEYDPNSGIDTAQVAQLAQASDVANGVFPTKKAVTIPATGRPTTSGKFNRFATFDKLKKNTQYVYGVGSEEGVGQPATRSVGRT
jgi:hypothetical protein